MKLWDSIRLASALVLLVTTSLAVLPAPTHLLWMVSVGVTEWGHVLSLICLGTAVAVAGRSWSGQVATTLCILAAGLALIPLASAVMAARALPGELVKAFGVVDRPERSPLVFADLFRGISPPEVNPQTFTYSSAGEDLSLDFYQAQTSSLSPLIVNIHGGSWNSGDNKDFIPMDRFLTGRGFAVADVLYRLAPQAPFPSASSDVRTAIEFLRERAEILKIDPNRIVLLGRSAGGQIALHVAYTARDPAIRGVISFYAPTDFYWSWDHPGNPLVIDTKAVLTDYLGGTPANSSANYAAASPTRVATATSPPTLLFYGAHDELVSSYHGAALSQRLTELGVPNLNVSLPWATHGFDYILRGPGGQISTYAIEWFLKRVFS